MKSAMTRVLGVCLSMGLKTTEAIGQTQELVRFHRDHQDNVNGATLPSSLYTVRDAGSDAVVVPAPTVRVASGAHGVINELFTEFTRICLSAGDLTRSSV